MSLTWKDGLTTLLAAGTAGALWANQHYESNAFWGSSRWMIGAVAVIGAAMCALGASLTSEDHTSAYVLVMDLLAFATLAVTVFGLVFGGTAYLVTLASIVGAMWLLATLRHLFAHSHSPRHAHSF